MGMDIDEAGRQRQAAAIADLPCRLPGQLTECLDTLAGNRHVENPARTVATIQHKGIENHYIIHARAILQPLGDAFRPLSGKGPYKRDGRPIAIELLQKTLSITSQIGRYSPSDPLPPVSPP